MLKLTNMKTQGYKDFTDETGNLWLYKPGEPPEKAINMGPTIATTNLELDRERLGYTGSAS